MFAVPDSILKETTNCPNKFSCLQTAQCGSREICNVQETYGKDILVLKTRESADCPYRLSFGTGMICRCPTHYAIHQSANGL